VSGSYDVDFVVIGAGSAGVRASRIAAGLGAKVVVVEERFLGGTCVNVGCVPKKLMVYGSHFAADVHEAEGYGWKVEGLRHDWPAMKARRDTEITRLNGVYERLLTGAGVEIVRGRGVIADGHSVDVALAGGGTRRISSRFILVATGGMPVRPTIAGAEHLLISDQVFSMEQMPKRVVVVGGGYIGVEFAGIFHGFGAEVTLVHRGGELLRGFDIDVREHLHAEMQKKGIRILLNSEIKAVDVQDGVKRCHVHTRGGDVEHVDADAVLFAIGRHPHTRGLGLENAGVAVNDSDAVIVNHAFQTSVDSIYACGDVISRKQLTPVALAEGMLIARRLFGGPAMREVDYEYVASAVFSQPPVGTVGISEDDARARGHAVEIFRSTFKPMKLTMTDVDEKTLMKIVVDKASRRVLGMHMVGPDAGEIIQGFAVAVQMGVSKEQLDAVIGIHPTAAEEFVTMRQPVPEPDAAEVARRTAHGV
jgi:glutathione reductase (NADPH)